MKITRLYQLINSLHAVIPQKFLSSGYAFPPLRVGCVLTHRCNLRCSMCFVWQHGNKETSRNELTTDEWKGIIDQIPGNAIVTFTGGEPLARIDFREIFTYACRKRRVHLVSNGTMFDDDLARLCIELAPKNMFQKGLVSLGVSLEGLETVHDSMVNVPGSFQRTIHLLRSMSKLKRENRQRFPLLDLKIVICRETLDSLVDLYDLSDEIGMDIISYQQCSTQESSYGIDDAPSNAMFQSPPPIDEIPRTELIPKLESLLERATKGRINLRFNPEMGLDLFGDRYENKFPLERFTCAAAWSVMHIGPYGTVFPCFSVPMGNLREKRLHEVWNGNEYKQFRKCLRKKKIFPGCTGCCVMKLDQ